MKKLPRGFRSLLPLGLSFALASCSGIAPLTPSSASSQPASSSSSSEPAPSSASEPSQESNPSVEPSSQSSPEQSSSASSVAPKTYTVTWKDYDGTLLETDEGVEEGSIPHFDGQNPTRNPSAQYTYAFSGWNPEIVAVTQDVTYYAQYTLTVRQYQVTFVNEDGTELQKGKWDYGTLPQYRGTTPTKAATEGATYLFKGWDKTIATVTEDVTYTATFTEKTNIYSLTWKNGSTTLKSETLNYGTIPAYAGSIPTKPSTAQYSYTFDGWSLTDGGEKLSQLPAIKADTVYYAHFDAKVREYTITFQDEDGTELASSKFAYGELPSYEGTPTKQGDAQYAYTFKGWDPKIEKVSGNATYKATYDKAVRSYLITWVDEDGTQLKQEEVEYGKTPVFGENDPTKQGDAQYSYAFSGWDPKVEKVSADATYKATYKQTVNQYAITWKNGEEVLKVDTLDYGKTPEYKGETPTKEADAQYTYTFKGWDKDIVPVTESATYTATFEAKIRSYQITFLDEDGKTVLDQQTLEYGATPAYKGEAPTKAGDAQYSYAFDGWDHEIAKVSGEATYKATYKQTVNTYQITFLDDDGKTVLAKVEVEYGKLPVYPEDVPTKEATATKTYAFSGWAPELAKAAEDATYTATYQEGDRKYTVTWKNGDEILQSDSLNYEETPVYKGETPTKEADAQYTYTFKDWGKEIVPVTADVVYEATFDEHIRSYKVQWLNGEEVLQSETLEYGSLPEYKGETPTKAQDAHYTYVFKEWDKEPAEVEGDQTYNAVFTETTRSYRITFFDEDGKTVLDQQTLDYGVTPEYKGEAPTKQGDAQYTYTFDGWDPELKDVVGEATYKAVYKQTVNQYEVVFKNGEEVLQSEKLDYGATPEYKGETPVKEATAQYAYTFKDWDKEIVKVTEDAVYEATFTSEIRSYKVQWLNGKEVLQSETLEYGSLPEYKGQAPVREQDAHYTYVFKQWDKEPAEVESDQTYNAVFTETTRSYQITFVDEDGTTVLDQQTLDYGVTPEYKGQAPTKQATAKYTYAFDGWDPELAEVTGEATYKAVYKQTINTFQITFLDEDGKTVLAKVETDYDAIPVYPGETPTKEATATTTYVFSGWTPALVEACEDATYTATYQGEDRKYAVTWKNHDGTVLKAETYLYESTPSYTGATPTKTGTAKYSYTFTGWTPEIAQVTEDAIYTATFQSVVNQYTITWKNGNATLATDKVNYGETPSYTGATPTKAEDEYYTYTFKGWDPTIAIVTKDATYTATFNSTKKEVGLPDPLYCTNNLGWSSMYAYAWNAQGNNKWPGAKMTYFKVNENDQTVYKIEGLSAYDKIIFNDGGSNQTVDISSSSLAAGDNAFWIKGDQDGSGHYKLGGSWYESGQATANYNFANKGQNILHCFDWPLATILANLDEIAAQGFNAIQTSPLQPVKDYDWSYDDTNATWWRFYQPVGLCIGNSTTNILFSTDNGAEELKVLTEEAAKRGIRIVVDVIVNHLADGSGNGGLHYQVAQFAPDIYNNYQYTLHNPYSKVGVDYSTVGGIVLSDAFGKDLNTSNSTVQTYVYNFLKDLVDCGVTGFRFDAAKHIETKYDSGCGSNFWENTLGAVMTYAGQTYGRSIWTYGEILNGADGGRSFQQYINDAWFYAVTALPGWYGLSGSNCVYWGESHDDYMGEAHATTYTGQDVINSTYTSRGSDNHDLNMLYFVRPVMDAKIKGSTSVGDHADWGWQNGVVKSANLARIG